MTLEKTNPYFTAALPNDDPTAQQALFDAVAALEAKRLETVNRLQLGAQRIDAARLNGNADETGKPVDVDAWETHWINLLHVYETTCDAIRAAQSKLHTPARKPEPRQTFDFDTEA